MAPPSHSLALARGIGLRREFEALITQSLPSAMGWHVVEDPAQVPYPLPFEFFPLVHTDDPIYVGVAFPTLALGGGRLARFCPPDGQYLDVCGTSGIWLAVHLIEAAKIDAPRDPEAGLRFLSQLVQSWTVAREDELGPLLTAIQGYAQADPGFDVRALPWSRDLATPEDPPNLGAAERAAEELNASLRSLHPPITAIDDADQLWSECRGRPSSEVPSDVVQSLLALLSSRDDALSLALRARHGSRLR